MDDRRREGRPLGPRTAIVAGFVVAALVAGFVPLWLTPSTGLPSPERASDHEQAAAPSLPRPAPRAPSPAPSTKPPQARDGAEPPAASPDIDGLWGAFDDYVPYEDLPGPYSWRDGDLGAHAPSAFPGALEAFVSECERLHAPGVVIQADCSEPPCLIVKMNRPDTVVNFNGCSGAMRTAFGLSSPAATSGRGLEVGCPTGSVIIGFIFLTEGLTSVQEPVTVSEASLGVVRRAQDMDYDRLCRLYEAFQ